MLIKNRTNVYDFNFHLVFVTKYRRAVFTTPKLRGDMADILNKHASEKGYHIENLKVMPDHVHMMISFPPKQAPAEVVKNMKGTAARLWFKLHPETKEKLWRGHLWSPSYFMSTLGNVSKTIVQQYIEDQMRKSYPQQKNG